MFHLSFHQPLIPRQGWGPSVSLFPLEVQTGRYLRGHDLVPATLCS